MVVAVRGPCEVPELAGLPGLLVAGLPGWRCAGTLASAPYWSWASGPFIRRISPVRATRGGDSRARNGRLAGLAGLLTGRLCADHYHTAYSMR
jgi:hypothetical protein